MARAPFRKTFGKYASLIAGAMAVSPVVVATDLASAQSVITTPQNPPPAGNPVDLSGIWQRHGALTDSRESRLAENNPSFKGEYLSIWTQMRAKGDRGERVEPSEHECLPRGMPYFNGFLYPTEILMTPGQITLLAEYYGEVRRVFTDGRPHPPMDELEPTFEGHSIGHWEGKTLVIDTVGVRTDVYLKKPGWHSDKMRIIERVTMIDPNTLTWTTRVEDPIALAEPWEVTRKLERNSPDTNIRDYACTENMSREEYTPSSGPILGPLIPNQ